MLSCAKPYFLKSKGLYVGCGSCLCCARKRSSAWALRVVKDIEYCRKKQEKEKQDGSTPAPNVIANSIYYITLSYKGKYLPLNFSENGKVVRGEGDGFLYRPDLTKFVKRLRSNIERIFGLVGLRVLSSGEYGPNNTHRPHFHLIVWNAPELGQQELQSLIEKSWSVYDRKRRERDLIGNVKVESVIDPGDVASYVSKVTSYVTKKGVSEYCKQPGETNADFVRRTGKLTVPFVAASLGVGADYFSENAEEISRLGYCGDHGFKVAMPRFFLDKVVALVGRDHFRYKVDRFLDYCLKQKIDLGILRFKSNRIPVYDYFYFKSVLRYVKRCFRYRLIKALDDCRIPKDWRGVFINGKIPGVSSFLVGDFLVKYGGFFSSYSDVVVKNQFFVDLLEHSAAMDCYNRLMGLLHLNDGEENIVQRYKNALVREKNFAQASFNRKFRRYMI